MEWLLGVGWAELVVPTHSVLEMVVRGTAMYAALFVVFRFVMKRHTGSIGIADILLIVVIADAAQNAFAKEYTSLTEGIVLVVTIVFWAAFIDWLAFKSKTLARMIEPPPLPLVRNGRILHRNLRQEFLSRDELDAQLRKAGVGNVSEVKEAWMESDGDISVIRVGDGDPRKKKKRKPT